MWWVDTLKTERQKDGKTVAMTKADMPNTLPSHQVSGLAAQPDAALIDGPGKALVSPTGLRRIFIRDLELGAEIGVYSHEHGKKQRIRLNLDLMVRDTQDHHDQLDNVVCYNDVTVKITRLLETGHTALVETLADKIAVLVMEDARILSVKICLEKLDAIKNTTSVGVEIERCRASMT